ncbi:MAG: heme ABC exporter ATP-binding protein CcmA [Longimicrobiales bacterium]
MSPSGTPERDSPPPLEARSLIRDFGALRAVDGIDLTLHPGEVVALFGPNGAGKSTLLRMLGGGLLPTSGEVRIGGEPLRPSDHERHRHIGVLSHRSFLYTHLTAAENLRFYGRLFGLDDLDERVPERLARVGLEARASDRVEGFSRGMRQRLALARTLLHDPEIVLLDEPYTGLDPHAAVTLREVLSSLRDGRRSVVLVTHNLTQGLELSNRAVILVRGRVAYSGRASEIDPDTFEHLYHQTVEAAA